VEFFALQNPESRDREIARSVHFANSGIASWEAEFFVLQNPSREMRNSEVGPFRELGYRELGGRVLCASKPRVVRSRNSEVGPFRELGYRELGGRVLCASKPRVARSRFDLNRRSQADLDRWPTSRSRVSQVGRTEVLVSQTPNREIAKIGRIRVRSWLLVVYCGSSRLALGKVN
jgi:hypothetical protein